MLEDGGGEEEIDRSLNRVHASARIAGVDLHWPPSGKAGSRELLPALHQVRVGNIDPVKLSHLAREGHRIRPAARSPFHHRPERSGALRRRAQFLE
jgi:hypothetical protein